MAKEQQQQQQQKQKHTKNLDILHGCVTPESASSTLISTGPQIDYIPTQRRHEVKGKGRKSMPVLLLPTSLIWASVASQEPE